MKNSNHDAIGADEMVEAFKNPKQRRLLTMKEELTKLEDDRDKQLSQVNKKFGVIIKKKLEELQGICHHEEVHSESFWQADTIGSRDYECQMCGMKWESKLSWSRFDGTTTHPRKIKE